MGDAVNWGRNFIGGGFRSSSCRAPRRAMRWGATSMVLIGLKSRLVSRRFACASNAYCPRQKAMHKAPGSAFAAGLGRVEITANDCADNGLSAWAKWNVM